MVDKKKSGSGGALVPYSGASEESDNKLVPYTGKSEGSGSKLVLDGPTDASSVSQTGNIAQGDIAGAGIDKSTHLHGDIIVSPTESQLARLYRELREQVEGDELLTEYIDQLQIFTREVDDEEIIGLDGKFEAANRLDQLKLAKQLKELVYRQLRQNIFSRTFQTIYATLLGLIHERFDVYVRPAIVGGASRAEIDKLVYEKVVEPVIAEIRKCPDCEDAPVQTVKGMLYFLTGNFARRSSAFLSTP